MKNFLKKSKNSDLEVILFLLCPNSGKNEFFGEKRKRPVSFQILQLSTVAQKIRKNKWLISEENAEQKV